MPGTHQYYGIDKAAQIAELKAERDALREAGLKALEHAEAHGLTDATYWVRDLRAALERD